MRVVRICLAILGAEHCFDATDTRSSVVQKLGEPFDTGGTSRKHASPAILVYDPSERIEFHFDRERLCLIYQEKDAVPVLAVSFIDS
jgi:hypothetical protein